MGLKPLFGIFGGAFDPPHNGHVALAAGAIAQCGLSRLFVIPTGQAWHKARPLSAASDRLAMARLAFAHLPEVVVDSRETERDGPTYTIDTLLALQAEHPAADWVLLLGADQWASFTQWHRWQELRQLAIILIAARAGVYWPEGAFDAKKTAFLPIIELDLPLQLVSSTQVRLQAAQLLTTPDAASPMAWTALPDKLVSKAVASYISDHRLYTLPDASAISAISAISPIYSNLLI